MNLKVTQFLKIKILHFMQVVKRNNFTKIAVPIWLKKLKLNGFMYIPSLLNEITK